MRIVFRACLFLCLILTAVSQAAAQSGRAQQRKGATPQDDTVRLRVEEVSFSISVRSKTEKLPTYLEPADFIVAEDGKRRPVTAVTRKPAYVLIIVDASGEGDIGKDVKLYEKLALGVINSLGPADYVAVLSYSDKVDLLSDWTTDKAALSQALKWKLRPGIKSQFHGCLKFAAEQVLAKAGARRTVLLLSDGVDSFDGGFEETIKVMHQTRATVYIANQNAWISRDLSRLARNPLARFEMIDPKVRKRYTILRRYLQQMELAESDLKRLAEETGGMIWSPAEPEGYNELSAKVIGEMETEYVITYSSEREPDDAKFREIQLFVSRPDITVRARRGVYPNIPGNIESGADKD